MHNKFQDREQIITITLINEQAFDINDPSENGKINIKLNPNDFIVGGMDMADVYEIISIVLINNSIPFETRVENIG